MGSYYQIDKDFEDEVVAAIRNAVRRNPRGYVSVGILSSDKLPKSDEESGIKAHWHHREPIKEANANGRT